ncbi:DUF362 domain-containing protein [Clostridium sp. P21]|uniref:DUF362 domain-containing protein n=1 Tax=Clostridium muellerianum TaxID=2716538 RepID=A0A7Y0EIY8_9CLOT|nr:DUF362 domain-containing protein [Clostridium muellerianum]NMM64339.1 DUF362 domain-containing protein [Clostridium muellerianum]
MPKEYSKLSIVNSPIGTKNVDCNGSAISGVRIDPSKAYGEIPNLLQKFINEKDNTAWNNITSKIDYIYYNLDYALSGLNKETSFEDTVKSELSLGKKLLFKPNLVFPANIDEKTHSRAIGTPILTEWALIAALMRWFHDKLKISYYEMALAEASTGTFLLSAIYSKSSGKNITTEAVFEGRSGDFYGGWGFYFVRKYLSERHKASHKDDPMKGYEDSIRGQFIPPGKASDRLMVYDLNKIQDVINKGRTIPVPDGATFKEITLSKVIIGGDPNDKDDLEDYPGCILINIPKLKMHAQDLITNAIKNLGIGLYPSQKYDFPHTVYPNLKGKLPHSPWVFEMDPNTHLPIIDENGNYTATKTAGFSGTQSDVIKAVQNENVFLLHVTDTINMINISHDPDERSVTVKEGYVFASLDCVALDLFCARYCFKTLPMLQASKLKVKYRWPTEFVHHVPVAINHGRNISTATWFDSPLFRYNLYRYAEERGIGQREYYILGYDSTTDCPLASLNGHLGRIDNGNFLELITKTLYYNPKTILHDLQLTILSYAKNCDTLTGTSLYKEFMDYFDENKDGIIDYDEKGRGFETAIFGILSYTNDIISIDEYGPIKKSFLSTSMVIRNSNKNWNSQGHDFSKEAFLIGYAATAYKLSQLDTVYPDIFIKGMMYGRGMWPSWQTVTYMNTNDTIYGSQFINNISLSSLYGSAFQYADKTLNSGIYTKNTNSTALNSDTIQYGDKIPEPVDQNVSAADSIKKYFEALSKGAVPLKFTLYVPKGFEKLKGIKIPNVEGTDDPEKIFTAHFHQIW